MAGLSRNNSLATLPTPSSGTPKARTAGDATAVRPIRPAAPAQLLASLGINSAQSTPTGTAGGRTGPFAAAAATMDEYGQTRAGSPSRADTSISFLSSPVIGETELRSLQKQWDSQERLLAGFQRENERCVAELERLRKRQRDQEAHLHRLYGPDWEAEIARSAGTMPVVSRASPSISTSASSSALLDAATSPGLKPTLPPGLDANTLLRHIDGVHTLVDSLQRQLKLRETELDALLASHEIAES